MITQHNAHEIEERLGWTFINRAWLFEALTHPTFANEHPSEGPHNQRLEFLGDAVLDLITSTVLFEHFPDEPEGELTRRRARIVRGDTLAEMARKIGLGDYVRLGEGQKRSGANGSKRILADAFEALAGAIYLDGGYEATVSCFGKTIEEAVHRLTDIMDYKTRLQEACHDRGLGAPKYRVTAIQGPDHDRMYTCEVCVGDEVYGTGAGRNKKTAEQICARQAYEKILALA